MKGGRTSSSSGNMHGEDTGLEEGISWSAVKNCAMVAPRLQQSIAVAEYTGGENRSSGALYGLENNVKANRKKRPYLTGWHTLWKLENTYLLGFRATGP